MKKKTIKPVVEEDILTKAAELLNQYSKPPKGEWFYLFHEYTGFNPTETKIYIMEKKTGQIRLARFKDEEKNPNI